MKVEMPAMLLGGACSTLVNVAEIFNFVLCEHSGLLGVLVWSFVV